MLLFGGAIGVVAFAIWIFCVIDVITTPPDRVRNLPKLVWLLVVILLVDIGAIAWLLGGRPWQSGPRLAARTGTPRRQMNPDDADEFLAGLAARAEEQRRRAREGKRDDEPGPTTS